MNRLSPPKPLWDQRGSALAWLAQLELVGAELQQLYDVPDSTATRAPDRRYDLAPRRVRLQQIGASLERRDDGLLADPGLDLA
jgi:hypothetical protein